MSHWPVGFPNLGSTSMSLPADMSVRACNCIGPRNGQPRCPCQMSGVVERDGRWVQLERDLGPVLYPTTTDPNRSGTE